jgi:signal transduction histidine kinase
MKPEAMPKEICCRNWQLLFDYLEHTEGFPSGLSGKAAVDRALEGLAGNPRFLIEDPDDPNLCYPVERSHLQDPRYWHSNEFSLRFFDNVADVIGGYRPLFRAGIICGYRTLVAAQPKYFQFLRLLSPDLLARFVKFFNKRFNNTKSPRILYYRHGFVRVQLGYIEKYKTLISRHVCDWNAGIYAGHGVLTGSFDGQVRETECCTLGHDDCIFEITYTHTGFWRRLLIFLHSMLDPEYIMGRDLDNLLLQDGILRQEGIIADKTSRLQQAHDQLLEQERLMTEAHIAGGMAHEIRNALGAAKLRLGESHTIGPLVECNQFLLELFRQAAGRPDLAPEEKEALVIAVRGLKNHYQSFGKTFQEIRQAIERGLSVANRVVNYSLLHQKAVPEFVDVQSTLENLYETYAESFQLLGIVIELDIEHDTKIQAMSEHLHAVFQNLLLNARDAIVEAGHSEGRIIICAHYQDTDVVIEVIDNGAGIEEDRMEKIFQPFYSTKPSRGMGLGLSECQKIIRNANGRIEVHSNKGKGSTFRVYFPLQESGSLPQTGEKAPVRHQLVTIG